MKNLKAMFVLLFLLPAFNANAYDLDTHFYGTYAMARFAGIRHEVAMKIATGTQWMDESYISDPLSMILLPLTGIKKRRLLHFPGSRLANKLTVDTADKAAKDLHLAFLDPSSGIPLKELTETEADHEFATEMFTEGLMEGNLMKASAGIHTLEDSFAHAGTISELGHAHFWHHPDRPYVDDVSVEKYFKMTRSVLKAMVAIRSLLPMNAIDTGSYSSVTPNYQLDGDQLADIYAQIPLVRQAVSRKILNDPNFVRFALDNVFQRAEKVNYVRGGYQPYLSQFTAGQDTYQAAQSIIKVLPEQMIDIKSVLKDSGYNSNLTPDFILSMGGISSLLGKIMNNLLTGIVPRPLDVYHRFEKEEDGPLWVKELDLRVATMRGLIYNLYKTDIFFVHNNTSSEQGFIKELSKQPEANPVFPLPSKTSQYVTYSLEEKNQFDKLIFSFLFPKLSGYIGNDLVKVSEFIGTASALLKKDVTFADKIVGVYNSVVDTFSFGQSAISFTEAIKLAREDIGSAHLIAHENNKFYAVPSLLQKEISTKTFKMLLNDAQLQSLIKH